MTGRDPDDHHRAASPLELLFDLTFVIAFGVAGEQFAHLLAEGHLGAGLTAFGFSMFAIIWAWINFTWFASAYDTDDWAFRLLTMVQMLGVLILALGLPAMFHAVDAGHDLGNGAMVLGYVIMRLAMVAQWIRVARQHPERRTTALTYVGYVSVAQVGWVVLWWLQLGVVVSLSLGALLASLEMVGPWVAEHKEGGTPWHAHHVVERYGLLTIIVLGEILLGTVASLSAVIENEGWTSDVIALGLAGLGLCFAIWWTYFQFPAGDALHDQRSKGFRWGYGNIVVFASIAAMGAGLHVAAYAIEDHSEIGTTGVVLTVAIPIAVYCVSMAAIVAYLLGAKAASWGVFAGKIGVIVLAVVLAVSGVALPICLLVLAGAPIVSVVAEELNDSLAGRDRDERPA